MKMKRFQNGDVVLSENEYKELMATKGGDKTVWDLTNLYIRHSRFYYSLKETQYKLAPMISIDPSLPSYDEFYRIRKADYDLFKALMKIINEFEPDRPV